MLIIALFLIIMSTLVLIVGGLGLATTVSMNVLDRTKEIGVMRAVGSTNRQIIGMVLTEGIIIGLMSFILASVLSVPLSQLVSYNFGMIFFEAPLRFMSSPWAYIIWFAVVVLFASLASFIPSTNINKTKVHETLAYE